MPARPSGSTRHGGCCSTRREHLGWLLKTLQQDPSALGQPDSTKLCEELTAFITAAGHATDGLPSHLAAKAIDREFLALVRGYLADLAPVNTWSSETPT
jgi:hypothetical protein